MKTDIQTLQDLFKISYETFEESREEERRVTDMYHNRQYNSDELAVINRRGQPPETFNVIKLFARLLVGFFSTVVTTVKVQPRQQEDTLTALLLHDIVQYTFEYNHFETEGDKIKLDGILSGIMCVYEDVIDTGRKDQYGRPIRRIELSYVPSREILLDPMSRKEDYSDARFIHRFKWVSEDYLIDLINSQGAGNAEEILKKLEAYENHVNQNDTEFDLYYAERFVGLYKQYDNYLLIHSIIIDDKGKKWSIFWCGDTEILRKEVTYREVHFPYRVQRVNTSDKAEYYGFFREILESQRAINQALLKIQVMVNSQKVYVQEGAVKDIVAFTDAVNRTNSVIPVKKLSGIKVEQETQEILAQYAIVEKAFERIQKILGINDSFLGTAYASDSGRKVKLQQGATVLALRYVSSKVEQLYRLLGWDIVNLSKQFLTANEAIRIADNVVGNRWIEINKPMQIFSGRLDDNGAPIFNTPFQEVLDPESGQPMLDENDNPIIAPVPEGETEIAFSDVDISMDSVAYNDEDEKNQLMLETVLQGTIGMTLLEFNPSAYLKAAGLSVKTTRTKNSLEIADIFEQTAQMIEGQPSQQQQQQQQGGKQGGQQPRSQGLKLPQNTNEN